MVRYDIFFSTPQPESIDAIHAAILPILPSYSLVVQSGSWESVPEHSYNLYAIGDQSLESAIVTVAKHLKDVYSQEAVLVSKFDLDTRII